MLKFSGSSCLSWDPKLCYPKGLINKPSLESHCQDRTELLTSPLLTKGGLQEDNPACTATKQLASVWLYSKLKQSQMAEPNSSYQHVGADWGLQTLRQACFQENPESAMCVQNFDDSRGLAIRITYRISLRSSSLWEPRHPLLKVVNDYLLGQPLQEQLVPIGFRYWFLFWW